MELVFIHGWGFDAGFWDRLAPLLPEWKKSFVDLGFFSKPASPNPNGKSVLIGHSLGFVHGIAERQDWAGWIAINSFPRFVHGAQTGCVDSFLLRTMRTRFKVDKSGTLRDFYRLIGSAEMTGEPDTERLLDGLDELRAADIGGALSNMTVPGLHLASRTDPLVPNAVSEAVAAKGARMEWHASGGHMLPQSDPAWCAAAIDNFLKTEVAA